MRCARDLFCLQLCFLDTCLPTPMSAQQYDLLCIAADMLMQDVALLCQGLC